LALKSCCENTIAVSLPNVQALSLKKESGTIGIGDWPRALEGRRWREFYIGHWLYRWWEMEGELTTSTPEISAKNYPK
jgi:hypothetical protein